MSTGVEENVGAAQTFRTHIQAAAGIVSNVGLDRLMRGFMASSTLAAQYSDVGAMDIDPSQYEEVERIVISRYQRRPKKSTDDDSSTEGIELTLEFSDSDKSTDEVMRMEDRELLPGRRLTARVKAERGGKRVRGQITVQDVTFSDEALAQRTVTARGIPSGDGVEFEAVGDEEAKLEVTIHADVAPLNVDVASADGQGQTVRLTASFNLTVAGGVVTPENPPDALALEFEEDDASAGGEAPADTGTAPADVGTGTAPADIPAGTAPPEPGTAPADVGTAPAGPGTVAPPAEPAPAPAIRTFRAPRVAGPTAATAAAPAPAAPTGATAGATAGAVRTGATTGLRPAAAR